MFRSFRSECGIRNITLTSSEYNISSDGAFLSLWTPCLVMFTSVCSKCGITNILGYVKCAHFIHDSITLTSSEFDVSSDGPLS
ncbi:hypothetical protein T02_9305 [Trichinella nativa]|uniref:Uncharacterized protein n=1 Tax=Trichinella nativa TaxID=6335 RepID=A0A0V1L2G6_9BILA|nr:hypothetical protein T02_14726 [Trichinella nativa]KRZ53743.1 hypothetical protein T02_9305 [Trichinella nativa]